MWALSYTEAPRSRKMSALERVKDASCAKQTTGTRHNKSEFFPNKDDDFYGRKPKITHKLIENLRPSLKLAYKLLAEANKMSHQNNKRLNDRKSKAVFF